MTRGSMRKITTLSSSSLASTATPTQSACVRRIWRTRPTRTATRLSTIPRRSLAQIRPEPLHELWFTSSAPGSSPSTPLSYDAPEPPAAGSKNNRDHSKPSERTLALGKTLRVLSPLLPNILTQPLPQSLLSPSITLHLFPSTHPHLPVVRGRVAYRAALFTAPVAWGSVPLVGAVKLQILSEKIVRTGYDMSLPSSESLDSSSGGEEKLVVRWKTEPKPASDAPSPSSTATTAASASAASRDTNASLSTLLGGQEPLSTNQDKQFSGLFIFTFDARGRIASHTIEHANESDGYDRTSKVVTLTDWLLGKAKGRKDEAELVPGLGVAAAVAADVRLAREVRRVGRWRKDMC
jgi:hypothetical protein